eukprot:CAMPEP_0201920204 /NCGR_PEP_ID=MMETSP0903-20130614/8875_1 /ASSEMBLY_ACC=CAM_ASM_000552 /TAXON_ID=420261 /ORGANISM="Thalassiosira antarctica, Strain CCMP982" /LENGTH=78 /DNA_ID=CAMNT_0048456895 /DNA_START=159 /DNA_END=396 /DNA_ORIENTATION=-
MKRCCPSPLPSLLDPKAGQREVCDYDYQGGALDLDDGSYLARAIGYADQRSLLSNELSHMYQLSGFAEPAYFDATMHD